MITYSRRYAVLRNDPVFIAGYPRSGTTMLYRMLAQYPEFGAEQQVMRMGDSAYETALSFFMSPLIDFDLIWRQDWPHWNEALGGEVGYRHLAADLPHLAPARALLERLLSVAVFGDRVFETTSFDVDTVAVRGWPRADRNLRLRRVAMRVSLRTRVIQSFLAQAAASTGAQRVLDKFPFHYYRFPELSVALPAARFVYIHRDPVDVYASMVHRARVELSGTPPMGSVAWLVLSSAAFVRDWCGSARAALAFSAFAPDRLLIVDYERLTSTESREAEITRLAQHLRLPPDSMLALSSQPDRDASRRFPLRSAFPTPNSQPFVDELAEGDIVTVRNGCRAEVSLLRDASW